MLSQEEISRVKEGVELVPFMQACGIELKKVGSNYRGLCPFQGQQGVKSAFDSFVLFPR